MTTGTIAAGVGRRMLGLADKLVAGIPAERFARLPVCDGRAIQTNHPAFVIGHLSLYGSRICGMVGDTRSAERVQTPESWSTLFSHGAECSDDPDRSIYPPMQELVDRFRAAYEAAAAAVEAADESRFQMENPIERMRSFAPTVGFVASFMLGGHPMFHLGQVSAWRRVEGLGTAIRL